MSDPITHLLPQELVEEIILKLSSKPLIRFKSVSKTWCSLISTPQFLAKHLLPAAHDGGKVLLVKRRHKTNTRHHVLSLLSDHKLAPIRLLPYPEPESDPDPEKLSPPISSCFHVSGPWVLPYPDLPPPTNPWPNYSVADVSILGSCNGLVCLFYSEYRCIVLWSTVDGELRVLPDSDVPDPPGYRAFMPALGFGYDEDKEDYKVIRISDLEEVNDEYGSTIITPDYHKVEIYSFNADRWKGYSTFEIKVDLLQALPHPSVAYVNGVVMWRAGKSQYHGSVLWLRMSDESFGETLLPSDAEIDVVAAPFDPRPFDPAGQRRNEYDPWWHKLLFVMNDKTVALVVYDLFLAEVETYFHLWVLLEYGAEDSWTRLFTVGPLTGIQQPLWLWNNGSMIMKTMGDELVLYDPFTKEMTSLNIGGLVGTSQIMSIEERYIL